MSPLILTAILNAGALGAYRLGCRQAVRMVRRDDPSVRLHSLPVHYGLFVAAAFFLPGVLTLCLWLAAEPWLVGRQVVASLPPAIRDLPPAQLGLWLNDIRNQVGGFTAASRQNDILQAATAHYRELLAASRAAMTGVTLSLATACGWAAWRRIRPQLRARNHVERLARLLFFLCSSIAVLTTAGIVLSVLFEALRFFKVVPVTDFLFGRQWSPQLAIRADQVGSSGAFGIVPVFLGTLMISGIAMCVAVPIGLLSAIYLAEYAHPRVRNLAKPLLEILAGIPTVVYGFFAALAVAPFFRQAGERLGWQVSSESALAAGMVMGIMIIPFISSLADDVIHAVPRSLREGALALGATRSEAVCRVVLPAALPGIAGGILLAVSRAIGETMIVVMAAGLAANLTFNPLEAVTTVTVQIVTLLVGDQEFDSPKTLAAFALALFLFAVTFLLNLAALHTVRRYQERYE